MAPFDHLYNQIRAHAIGQAPREACGLIANGHYVPCGNTADEPESNFQIATRDYVKARELGTLQAVVHSHIHPQEDCPTKVDMEQQIASAVPWGIIHIDENGEATNPFWFGDQIPIPELLGRVFRYGVTDCYALARDWYAMNTDIQLPPFPRENYWWDNGEDLLVENFEALGFREVPNFKDIRKGDGILGNISGSVANHCGVYIGDGLMIHHLPERLSRIEPASRWVKNARMIVRHQG